jgi:hypothetical protein
VVGKRERLFGYEKKEKPPDFGNREGNHDWEIRRQM